MKIDEILLKVSAGQIVLDADLNIDEDVAVMVKGSITKEEYKSNQDGTSNKVLTLKGEIASVVYRDKDGNVLTQEDF